MDPGGYMRILTIICSGVGSRDTCVSKKARPFITKECLFVSVFAFAHFAIQKRPLTTIAARQ